MIQTEVNPLPQFSKPTAIRSPSRATLDAVLRFAWRADAFVSSDVMPDAGLTRSTAFDAIDTLIQLGLIRELPNARAAGDYSKGRPARRFELQADAAVLVGVDAGANALTATVTDLRSAPLAVHRAHLDPEAHPDMRRAHIAGAVDAVLADAGVPRDKVLALCIGVPAPVNAAGRSPRHRLGFWQRMNPQLTEEFSAWAPALRIENDALLAAIAEGTVGAAVGCTDYIALLAGTRLGAGVVLDGHELRGVHGGAGEMLALAQVKGVESAHGLGVRMREWALEAIASGEADPAGRLALLPPEQIDAARILELASFGDPDARLIARRCAETLARIVSVLGNMFDPQRVVVSGAIADGIGVLLDDARDALPTDLHLPPPDLVVSTMGADVVVRGAICAASTLAVAHALDVWTAA